MSDWQTYSLEEITEPVKETYNPTGSDDIAYIGLEHIEQETLRLNSIGKSTDVSSNKFKFKADDILFGKLRPYFRKVVKPNFEGICSTDIWVFRSKENVNQDFLYYFLANWDFVNTANGADTGTRMPRADWNFLKSTIWEIPSPHEQKFIGETLAILDEKIDLLHRQNKTLEELAETLFRQWFVEEADDSWEEKTLGDLIEIKSGYAYKGEFIGVGDSLLLSMGCVSFNNRFLDTGARAYSGDCPDRYLVKPGDLVIATRQQSDNLPILGFPAIVPDSFEGKKIIVGANLYRVANISSLSNYMIYLLLKTRGYKNHIASSAKGSTVRMITKDAIESYPVSLPPKASVDSLDIQIDALNRKSLLVLSQIRTLTQLRDTLLPKLMNGEIKLKQN